METRRESVGTASDAPARTYRLQGAAQTLNRRFGLYLSEGQQRGLAVGLLAGAVVASAALAWALGTAARRSSRW